MYALTYRTRTDGRTEATTGGTLALYSAGERLPGGATPDHDVIVLDAADIGPGASSAMYVVDDGTKVRPFYVAGWQPGGDVYLHPFPTADGAIRPDNGRPVDYSTWIVTPRRAYHIKLDAPGVLS